MNQPDQLSREYATILPDLKRIGYRADLKGSYEHERFLVTVSRKPTTRVHADGTWIRDDGKTGDGPQDLLRLYREERAAEAWRHWDNHDVKGVAGDILTLSGHQANSILEAAEKGRGLEVTYHTGRTVESVRITRVRSAFREAVASLES